MEDDFFDKALQAKLKPVQIKDDGFSRRVAKRITPTPRPLFCWHRLVIIFFATFLGIAAASLWVLGKVDITLTWPVLLGFFVGVFWLGSGIILNELFQQLKGRAVKERPTYSF